MTDIPLSALISRDEAVAIGVRVGVGYARIRPWLDIQDVVQEASAIALAEWPKTIFKGYLTDPSAFFGWIIKRRLHSWQKSSKFLYQGGVSTTNLSLDLLHNADPYIERGYWFIEELSAYDEYKENKLAAVATRKRDAGPTRRHIHVLQLLSDGHTLSTAAEELGIGVETARTYSKQFRIILQAKNTTHAVAIAWRRGLIT